MTKLDRVVEALRAGEPVILATDTVYGLAAAADRSEAVSRIFALKNRPVDVHMAVLVADPITPRPGRTSISAGRVRRWPPSSGRARSRSWHPAVTTGRWPRATTTRSGCAAPTSRSCGRWRPQWAPSPRPAPTFTVSRRRRPPRRWRRASRV
ncbi:MAG: hypothetical protein GWN79_08290 [Actinobacteria bacterium]|nr:hypothetical protein [Actinomycetota bacterium]NIS30960.1 hypothetical protein [Actinomycetota bacterium]NIT95395.1 hypothetical protein [Actinomycetota bacterium]NIU19082.1 hypothetical protein [Actinomycetota bacterium]NIU66140.1 hypothetical protein [Actinomycetota bacterium]